ncbi:LPS export ABC transporter periplasmic protein LptC [Brevundimonas sp.]|uniref:LPS export ABC transporter periplasmic protein LptC n=1 Tax=Brevundimonas sp. TaxID=1871086 RepID=UPI001DA1D069|nr:LPS export ABC transporter periplasmic protein LptC [Brevundimonas sp.]MBA4000240.1 LPS export ABC transporter periplasmic protein LptC [Brevundimonas sp.]
MSDPTPGDDLKAADERRVVLAGRQWRARSRRVMLLRRVLPIAIAVLAGGTVLWVGTRSIIAGVERSRVESREVRLSNPMFHGQDEQGRSFVIGAAQAVRDPDTGMFRLDAPVMRLTLEAGKTSELSAGHGLYDESSRTLILRGQVIIEDAGAGFRFVTPEAVVDTRTGVVTGDKGIQGAGALGTIDASSYAIYEQGGRVVFSGSGDDKVRTTINTGGAG